jgi:tRNA A-37 threonylcarbamoyl transferase component Bud32
MIGQTLTHYKIEDLLGQGGMGVVYRARDTRLERSVALKLLKPDLVADPDRKNRFLREARSAAAVTHPAIAQVYDIDEAGGTTFIAMEYVDGRTVGRLIAEGELDLLGSVEIIHQVAEGLAKAHEANIIHRDIKSDNIMVTRDGHAKLLDFGLAKLLESGLEDYGEEPGDISRTLSQRQAHTLAGAVLGTINYMSPEQARGRTLDLQSDIFSLGIVLYEMVTGELPFQGATPLDTMHAIVFEEAKPVMSVRKNLPPQLQQIISRCLRKRPQDRYPDARALAADLKRLRQDIESGSSLSLPAGERLRGWIEQLKSVLPFGTKGMIILAAALVLAVALIFTKIQWGSLVGAAMIVLIVYRSIRNRRMRMLRRFSRKVAEFPAVRAVIVRGDIVTVIMDKAPAKTYIRITGLIDSINERRFFGKPVTAEIKDDLTDQEFQSLLRKPGVFYVRDDVMIEPARKP